MYSVKKRGQNWAIVDKHDNVVEGGFFDKQAAIDALKDWN